jgi:tRNA(Ile)-lysidine synthase
LKVYTAAEAQGSSIEDSVAAQLGNEARVVLAVSGGIDSMVLLHAAARVARRRICAVATFDHGTGSAAKDAVALVRAVAWTHRLVSVAGVASDQSTDEDALRKARFGFLGSIAAAVRARIVTAHTLDDQIETVCMRILRDAGARGLAGMYAPADTLRPMLEVSRADVRAYASRHALRFVEDPSNLSPRYFRNRVRNDLLPAIERVRPGFSQELLRIARSAAEWREGLETVVDSLDWVREDDGSLSVGADPLIRLDSRELRTLWPALGARGGIRFDRRGTERLASFTKSSQTGATMQLSGGFEVRRERQRFVLRRR